MAETKTEIETIIAAIDVAVTSAITNPKPSYKIGDVSFDWNGYVREMARLRKMYVERLNEVQPPIEEETLPDLT